MLLRRAAAFSLALSALVACNGWPGSEGGSSGSSSSGSAGAPASAAVIDEVDLPANAQAMNAEYDIIGSITFHDDAVAVDKVQVVIPVIGKTLDYNAGDVMSAAGYEFDIQVSADVPLGGAGATNFEISLVDKNGGVTAPVVKTVILQ